MAPQDYIQARTKGGEEVVTVDGRPYWPFLLVDTTSHESVKEVAAKVLLLHVGRLVPDWKRLLDVTPIVGGNTNSLFRVSGFSQLHSKTTDSSIPNAVLVRVFGAEGIIDRDVENATYAALWRQDMVPIYYGRFQNGRIEQFLEGMRPLQDREMAEPAISQHIARHMAQLHAQFEIPHQLQAHHNIQKPQLWQQLKEWMQQALDNTSNSSFVDPNDMERIQKLIDIQKLPAELEWLETSLVPKDTPACFCHNDVLASNIMYSNNDNDNIQLQLIDFEYGGINYQAFDIANHFNEFAGGTDHGVPNYEWMPDKAFQLKFMETYLQAFQEYQQQHKTSASTTSNDNKQEQVLELQRAVEAFILVDHCYWGLWGVNQAATEGCHEFDYLLYASHRINQYYRCKENLQKQQQQS